MIKLLSLTQPWAALVVHGFKRYETRGWYTDYLGRLAIHATKGPANALMVEFVRARYPEVWRQLTTIDVHGAILGTTFLYECRQMDVTMIDGMRAACERELHFGTWAPNRYALDFRDSAGVLEAPIAIARGSQGRPIPLTQALEERLAEFKGGVQR